MKPLTLPELRVCAVVVNYNRLDLLKIALGAVRNQTRRPDRILVVDNGSTDETSEWLAAQDWLRVIRQMNLGACGGVHAGISAAYAAGHDWFWIVRDDTIPAPEALEKLWEGVGRSVTRDPGERLGWFGSVVQWSDGNLHRMSPPRLAPYLDWSPCLMVDRQIPASWCSFVSLLVSREAVASCGLPIKEMVIWYDDVEFTARISLAGFHGYIVLDSIVEHRTRDNHALDLEDLEAANYSQFAHAFRNEVMALRTILEARPIALGARFLRVVARRCWLLLLAGKPRYIPLALGQGLRGLLMKRKIEFPALLMKAPVTTSVVPRSAGRFSSGTIS